MSYEPLPSPVLNHVVTPCVNHDDRQADTFTPNDRRNTRPLCSACATPHWVAYLEGTPWPPEMFKGVPS